MIPSQRLAAVVASTTSILFVQFFPLMNPARDYAGQPAGFSLTPAALANQSSTAKSLFSLPVDSKPRRSDGSGSRGCQLGDLGEVKLLIPSQEVAGQTISGHPTFFLHLSKSQSVPVKFTLAQPGGIEPIYELEIDAPEAGIIKIELPEDRPELATNDIYLWSVSLICNEKRPSANPYYFSWVERVPTPPQMEQSLSDAETPRDRAAIYANMGAWYDALAALYEARSANPDDAEIKAELSALLSEVGLTEVAQN